MTALDLLLVLSMQDFASVDLFSNSWEHLQNFFIDLCLTYMNYGWETVG